MLAKEIALASSQRRDSVAAAMPRRHCDAATSLDAIGPKLCEAGVGYHAHISSMAASSKWGSIWTGGVGGWGVEFHMKFDFSFFNQSRLDLLDCARARVYLVHPDVAVAAAFPALDPLVESGPPPAHGAPQRSSPE